MPVNMVAVNVPGERRGGGFGKLRCNGTDDNQSVRALLVGEVANVSEQK